MEECSAEIEVISHFYTTDFYIKSAFNDSQVIGVYYLVKNTSSLDLAFKTEPFDFDEQGDVLQSFRWVNLADLRPDDVTFPADRHVVKLLTDK